MRRPFWQSPPAIGGALAVVVSVLVDLVLSGRASGNFGLFFGRLHPLVVHLPIGVLVAVGCAEAASLVPSLRERVDRATSLVLPLVVASAVASFVVGHLLAGGGGFPTKLVLWHRRLTLVAIVGSGVTLVAWAAYERLSSAPRRLVYRGLLGLTLAALSVGAHYGGSITRGEGYLTKYAPDSIRKLLDPEAEPEDAPAEKPPEPGPEPLVWGDVVLPIMKARCVECHGPETVKAGLRLDSLEGLEKGGENGPVMIKGAGDKSSLVSRMRLPSTDDERMPPEGRDGPSAEEIALVAWWIDRGASGTLRVRDALAPESTRAVLSKALSAQPAPSASSPATVAPSAEPSASPSAEPSTEPPAQGSVVALPGSATGSVYGDYVAPVLGAKCAKCHGEAKQKGKLRVDSIEAIFRGGKEGPAAVAGASGRSSLLSRAKLAISDPEHMPPPREPQLTDKEIALLAFWIDQGARADLSASELPADLRGAAPRQTDVPRPPPTSATAEPSASAPPAPTDPPPALPAEIELFHDVIHPVLVAKCAGCHGEEQDSGDLRVDVADKLLAGGESGPAIVAGAPDKSLLLQRVHLPLDDTDHMPPEGEPQLTKAEAEALRYWIAQGATTAMPLSTAALNHDVSVMLAQALPPRPAPAPSASATAPPSPAPAPTGPPVASASTSGHEPQGPPAAAPGGCAGCTFAGRENRLAPLGLVAAVVLWLRKRARRSC